MKVRLPDNTIRTVKAFHIRTPDNVSRVVSTAHLRNAANVSRIMFSSGTTLTVTASPINVSGATNLNRPINTNVTTAVITGGKPPYVGSWQLVSGADIAPNNPTALSTYFTSPPLTGGTSNTATFKYGVTDARGDSADSPIVSATVENYGS